MKSTGIVRNIDELGRIVIPKEMRKTLNIQCDDPMEIFVEGDRIVLSKYVPNCIFCGNHTENTFKGKKICPDCIDEIIKA